MIGAVAITNDVTFAQLTDRDMLNLTCNLVVEDKANNCLRYAHLSVGEFLDGRREFSDDLCHQRLAERCLESHLRYHTIKDPLSKYAMRYWAAHYAALSSVTRNMVLHSHLIPFLFQGDSASQSFFRWRCQISGRNRPAKASIIDEHCFQSDKFARSSSKKTFFRIFDQINRTEEVLSAASTPFLVACICGMREVLEFRAKTQATAFKVEMNAAWKVNGSLLNGYNGLHIAIYYGYCELVDFLLSAGLKTSTCTARGQTPLTIAIHH